MLSAFLAAKFLEHKAKVVDEATKFFIDRADDWRNVIPEADDCLRECQNFLYIIDPAYRQELLKQQYAERRARAALSRATHSSSSSNDTTALNNDSGIVDGATSDNDEPPAENSEVQSEYQSMGDNSRREHLTGEQALIQEIVQRIEDAKKVLEAFLYESKKDKSFFEEIAWVFKRSQIAAKLTGENDYREYFRITSRDIRRLLNNLTLNQKITDRAAEPRLSWFKKDMTEEAYLFWKMHIGPRIVAHWIQFIDAYTLLYGTVDPVDLRYIETILPSRNSKKLTVYGFINFTKKYSFPFPKNIATRSGAAEKPMSEEGRMDLTKMVMTLVTDFSSNDMRTHLLNLYSWYSANDKESRISIQNRANEWAYLMKEMRDKKEKHPVGVYAEAEEVDKARRAIYFFYQRFMVMWRVGQVSRETLNNVDFPGKGRIRDFIHLVGPLDQANYYIVMGKEHDEWKENKPQIYTFLEQYLTMLGDTSIQKEQNMTFLNGTTQQAKLINAMDNSIQAVVSSPQAVDNRSGSSNTTLSQRSTEMDVEDVAVGDNGDKNSDR